jgi:hypothetical protein
MQSGRPSAADKEAVPTMSVLLVRTFLVECGSATALRGCTLSTMGHGRLSPSHAMQPAFTVQPNGSVVVTTSHDWPSQGVKAALTITPLAQGAGAHDTHASFAQLDVEEE